MSVHHITEKMIEGKRRFSEYIEELNTIFESSVCVAHNAPFDVRMCVNEGAIPPKYVIDTKKVAQALLQYTDNPPESYSMQYLRYFLGLEITEDVMAHDAKGDVIVLKSLFYYLQDLMIKNEFIDNPKKAINRMIEITRKPLLLRFFPFGKHKGVDMGLVPLSYLLWAKQNLEDAGEDLIYTINEEIKNRH